MDGQTSTVYSQGAGGYGMSGFGGIAPFGLFGLFGLNNGLGYGNNAANDCLDQRITDLQIAGVNQNINGAESNLTQATLMQTNNLGSLIMDGNNGLTNTVRTVGDVLAAQTAGVKDSVQANQFQTALQTKEILESNAAQTQAILDKLCAQETQALRDALQDEKTARQFAERGLLTATGPNMAVIQPNPCRERGIEQDITVINNQIGLINENQTKIATALNALAAKQ